MKRFAPLILAAAAVTTIAGRSISDADWDATMKWCVGPIEEIADSNITRDGRIFLVRMESRIDAPPDEVWAAMKQPEKLSQNSEQYKKSDLLKDEGNHKELELHVMALDNLQQLTVAMDFDDASRIRKIRTITTTIADIEGTYTLTPSPDSKKTVYRYEAKYNPMGGLPIAAEIHICAIKVLFVQELRAIRNQIAYRSRN